MKASVVCSQIPSQGCSGCSLFDNAHFSVIASVILASAGECRVSQTERGGEDEGGPGAALDAPAGPARPAGLADGGFTTAVSNRAETHG